MSLIEVKNLDFSYNETKKVIKNISFDIKKGDYVTIIGHNGSGKSTLARLLIGLLDILRLLIVTPPDFLESY